jgi:hypothetical protein
MCIDVLPDGRLLVVSSADRQLLRREPDGSLRVGGATGLSREKTARRIGQERQPTFS